MKNMHDESIPKDVIDQVKVKVEEIQTLMSPFFITLTTEQRQKMLKMGEKALSFVTNANSLSKEHPELIPSFITQEDFDIDVADATELLPLENNLLTLASQVNDTAMIAGSEAYNNALLFYNNVKLGAKNNVPGAKEVYDELKTHFPRRKRKVETEEV
ncbi:hypothetical protein [Carboxylicivirga marina]|uniref:Uncharacterized protein n=1 Tax=Carboxylicivirga marina TaxID=2800988 RepID=A0ABS1HHD9_9BACT|nr:hypothetical protein [Carboxylicivirga marina]MBK3517040.1 hypothetical protein [Carboxylicivirga marina]